MKLPVAPRARSRIARWMLASLAMTLWACGSSTADHDGDGGGGIDESDSATPPGNGSSSGSGSSSSGSSSGGSTGEDAAGGSDRDAGAPDATDGDAGASAWDLTGWQLQLPIGAQNDPQMVDNPTSFSDAYFYIDPSDGALTFMDPRTGVTTMGSSHPRSELKEDTSGWPATGTNEMTATVAVPLVPSTVTIGQIFQAGNAPSKPLLELQYQAGGHVQTFLESSNQGSSGQSYDAGTVTDMAQFDYALSLTNNEIQVTVNSEKSSYPLPSSFVGEVFYFKWGDYDQTAAVGTPSTTPGTIVKFYAHGVTHQ